MRTWRPSVALRVTVLLALAFSLVGVTGAVAATPRAPVAWGVYMPGAPTDLTRVWSLGTSVDKQPGMVMWYPNWGGPYSSATVARADVDAVLATGAVPMLTWMTRDPSTTDPAVA